MAGEPIRLGSAAGARLVFETGSKITTSDAGIQESSIKAIYGDAEGVFDVLPAAGATFNSVFGNNFLPNDFKVDLTGGGHDVEYVPGQCARVTIKFKRPDPNATGPDASRKIYPDTTIRFVAAPFLQRFLLEEFPDLVPLISEVGLPEPTVTVKYNDSDQPSYDRSYFAPPGSSAVAGFPSVPKTISVPFRFSIDGTPEGATDFLATWVPNPKGWQLQKLQGDPVADESAWEITEIWRLGYIWSGYKLA